MTTWVRLFMLTSIVAYRPGDVELLYLVATAETDLRVNFLASLYFGTVTFVQDCVVAFFRFGAKIDAWNPACSN